VSWNALAFGAGQRAVLEQIAAGAPLATALDAIVRLIEQQADGMLCSILLLDDAPSPCVHTAAAPSLPPAYSSLVDGVAIGPEVGSCGTAAYRAERVIVDDIATHPYWRAYKDVALAHGLRACWSSPIFSARGEVLGTFAMYYRHARAPTDEEIHWVDAATHLASIAILHDQSEQSRRASEELRSLIYASVTDAIFYLAVEGPERYRFLSVNRAFVSNTGLAEQEVVGKLMHEVLPPGSCARAFARHAEAIASRAPVSWEECVELASGVRHGDVTITPIFDAGGRCTNLVGTVHDMTRRKQAVAERHKLELELGHAERLKGLGTLAGGIAHDFNNILTAIAGHAQLMLEDIPPGHPAHDSVNEIRKGARRATDLVRQISTFGQQAPPRREAVDLVVVIDEALRLLRASLRPSLALSSELDAATPCVLGDASQLHQVIMNLGTNAAHAIGDASGQIHVSTGEVRVEAAPGGPPPDVPPGRYARLTVRDNGSGMSREVLERVFEPFFTTKGPGGGTGLGLSVVHGVVTAHEGVVRITSEPGVGTTINVYFPATDLRASELRSYRPERVRAQGEHVLYVDDEEALVFLATRMLRRMGYRVTGHSSSLRALEDFRARAAEFDAVVTDISMPGLSGQELARELLRVRPDLPVVMTSGFIRPEDTALAEELGVKALIPKPNTVEDFAQLLHDVIAARRSVANAT
jgi:PAS domain S-box-containing protein